MFKWFELYFRWVPLSNVPSVVNDLWSQLYAPPRTRQHTMAANEGVTKSTSQARGSILLLKPGALFLWWLTLIAVNRRAFCVRMRASAERQSVGASNLMAGNRELTWTPRYRWKIATRPETQITHTQDGRQSLAPVDTIRKQREQETVSHPECE